MTNQQPPVLTRKQKRNSTHKVFYAIIVCALSFVCAFIGTGAANIITQRFTSSTSSSSRNPVITQNGGTYSGVINDVSDIAAKCGPSVVEIRTEYVTNGNSFFGNYVQQGAGSGVIWSEDGYIVTNNHVIEDAQSIRVTTTDGQEADATLIGTDPQTDLAVIKIDAQGLQAATIGDSDSLEVGDPAIAIGNPLGELGGTVTTGIISALDREITVNNETMTLLQTDAAINPGNSGGGLFDGSGNLIGIVNAKQSSSGIEGLGFAIPISGALDVIDQLMNNGQVSNRPALNVSLYDYAQSNSFTMGRSNYPSGVYIVQIVNNGAADKAGLQKMDRIVSFDGNFVETSAQVKSILRKHKIGDQVEMVVDRDGEEIRVTITLQEQTTQAQPQNFTFGE